MDKEIRMKGKGTVHFKDEHGRPREIKGSIIVDYKSMFHPPFVKIETTDPPKTATKLYLMPFSQITYIEWDILES